MRIEIAAGSVKICSLREPVQSRWVRVAGADFYGLIFVPGARRRVSVDQAQSIVAEMRESSDHRLPRAVGVFLDSSADEMNAVSIAVGLDLIQLHGEEPPELLAELPLPAIKAIRPAPDTPQVEVERTLDRYAAATVAPVAFLLDGFRPGTVGGEGVLADWNMAGRLARNWPVILAGGLTPENVAEAIATVGPLGVDVSSGVETDQEKDPSKITAFVAGARMAFAARSAHG